MNRSERLRSIRRLAKLHGIALLATAHSGYTKTFREAAAEWAGM
jgi:hypothetical protein